MNLGDAFVNLPDGTGYPSHLWFVITRPTGANRVAIVNISSENDGVPDLPIFRSADHSWPQHDSFVRTAEAALVPVVELTRLLTAGRLDKKAPLTAAALKKLQIEIHASRHTQREIVGILEDQGFI